MAEGTGTLIQFVDGAEYFPHHPGESKKGQQLSGYFLELEEEYAQKAGLDSFYTGWCKPPFGTLSSLENHFFIFHPDFGGSVAFYPPSVIH